MITRFLRKRKARLWARWLRDSIDKALALNRYDVRRDRLSLMATSFRLTIAWRARHVHPWDRDLKEDKRATRLVDQTFADTIAALEELFITLPEVDVIDLKVLEADEKSDGILMSGSVSRNEFETWHPSSIPMRLRLLGVSYNLVDKHFEPLVPVHTEHEIPSYELAALHRSGSSENVHPGEVGRGPPQTWHQDKAGPH
jgi:hypothetical protein